MSIPDLDLNELIRSECPDIKPDTIEPLGVGDFFGAFLVNGTWVFLVAKHDEARASIRREACLLPRLAAQVDLQIPEPVYHGERFIAYRKLPGTALTQARFLKLDQDARDRCARQVATFLERIHGHDLDSARECGVLPFDFVTHYHHVLERARRSLPGALSTADWEWAEGALEDYLEGAAWWRDFTPVLLHRDVSPAHVLFDPGAERVTGILDFSDLAIGDPAWDLIFLYEDYGIDFLARVLPVYPHSHADLERMYRYYEMEGVEWAVSGVEGRHRDRLAALGQVGRLREQADKPRWRGLV